MPRLLSVNVGLPRDIAWRGETVRTAIWKEPVQGPRMVRRLNLDGDGQADLAGHGGELTRAFPFLLPIYKMAMEEVRCGAVFPDLEPSIPMIDADFLHDTSKSVEVSPKLPNPS